MPRFLPPDDAASRGRVLAAVGEFLKTRGEDPVPDVGQEQVFISLD